MKIFFRSFWLLTCLIPYTTFGMQQNAGAFGTLPPELVHEIASYCELKDRCAMRCTGKYLNTNLKYFYRKQLNTTVETCCGQTSLGVGVIQTLCLFADAAIATIALKNTNLSSLTKFAATCTPPALFFATGWALGPCNLLLRRPAAYCWGLATHLFYRKKIAAEARQAFRSKDEYVNDLEWNFENNALRHLYQMQDIQKSSNPCHSSEALEIYTEIRVQRRIHSTICQALLKHDE